MNLNETDWIVAFWFVGYDGGNWTACMVQRGHRGPYTIECRFRRYVDEKLGPDSEDEKSFTEATVPEDELAKGLAVMDLSARFVALVQGADIIDRVDVNGDISVLHDKLKTRPYVQVTTVEAKA